MLIELNRGNKPKARGTIISPAFALVDMVVAAQSKQ